jgi:hypothetical protein
MFEGSNSALLALVISLIEDTVSQEISKIELNTSLRGPRGLAGLDGVDGKDFDFEDHKENIRNIILDHKELFVGAKGLDGVDGKDFNFEENLDKISNLTQEYIESIKEDFKLKFSDLSQDEIESLRGPRGQKGKQGHGFDYEEHKEKIESFLDNSMNEFFNKFSVEDFKLKFSDLTEDDKNSLKLKFDDLSIEDKFSLRGARGQRGRQGIDGQDGKDFDFEENKENIKNTLIENKENFRGPMGLRGETGAKGEKGDKGAKGDKGDPGQDAPVIEDVYVDQSRDKEKIEFVFDFNDGTRIRSNEIELPKSKSTSSGFMGGGGGGSIVYPPGETEIEIFEDGVSKGTVTKIDFKNNVDVTINGDIAEVDIVDQSGTANPLEIYDEGDLRSTSCERINFVGSGVRVTTVSTMADWDNLADVDALDSYPSSSVVVEVESQATLNDVDCDASVFVGAFVRMNTSGIAVNALADVYANSNVIGLVEAKSSATKCTIRFLGVSIGDIYAGLDIAKDYFLSATNPGELTDLVPTASGNIKLKLGQAYSETKFFINKGERVVRL